MHLLAHFSLLSRQKVNRTTVDSQVVLQCVGALRLVDASNNGNDYDGIGGAWSVVDDFYFYGVRPAVRPMQKRREELEGSTPLVVCFFVE